MRTVALVAPYALPNTMRYVRALCALPDIRPAIISADPLLKFPADVRRDLAGFAQVHRVDDARALANAAQQIGARIGKVERLFGALEQLQMTFAIARDLADIPGMGAEKVRRFRDKSAMKAAFNAANVPCARHVRVESLDDARRFAETVGLPAILKPVAGVGTQGTWRITDMDELRVALDAAQPSPARPCQLEEMLRGTEHTFETVTIDGKPIWSSATDYLPGPLEVVETPWIQYCVVLPRETEGMARFAATNHAALAALGMGTGLTHMEWFARDNGTMAVNEVGARPPGVNIMPLMSHAHGVDMIARWVRLMALDTFEPPQRKRAAGSAFFRGQGDGKRVVAVHGLAEAQQAVGEHVVDVQLPEVGQAKASGYEGEGFAIVAADTTAEVMSALGVLIQTVRVELG